VQQNGSPDEDVVGRVGHRENSVQSEFRFTVVGAIDLSTQCPFLFCERDIIYCLKVKTHSRHDLSYLCARAKNNRFESIR